MKEITSLQNSFVKEIKKIQQSKYRKKSGTYLLEGMHLVEEAVAHKGAIQWVLITEKCLQQMPTWWENIEDSKKILVTEEIMKSLSEVPAPQGILAVIQTPQVTVADFVQNKPLLLLDNIQDPGNVGTMIRTADAAGFGGVLLGNGSADIYQGKVLRAMQGSHFHLPIVEGNLLSLLPELIEEGYQVYGTALDKKAVSYKAVNFPDKVAFVLGNEGQGVSPEILAITHQNLYIPMKGAAESLNVAVAAGILMFSLS